MIIRPWENETFDASDTTTSCCKSLAFLFSYFFLLLLPLCFYILSLHILFWLVFLFTSGHEDRFTCDVRSRLTHTSISSAVISDCTSRPEQPCLFFTFSRAMAQSSTDEIATRFLHGKSVEEKKYGENQNEIFGRVWKIKLEWLLGVDVLANRNVPRSNHLYPSLSTK